MAAPCGTTRRLLREAELQLGWPPGQLGCLAWSVSGRGPRHALGAGVVERDDLVSGPLLTPARAIPARRTARRVEARLITGRRASVAPYAVGRRRTDVGLGRGPAGVQRAGDRGARRGHVRGGAGHDVARRVGLGQQALDPGRPVEVQEGRPAARRRPGTRHRRRRTASRCSSTRPGRAGRASAPGIPRCIELEAGALAPSKCPTNVSCALTLPPATRRTACCRRR